MKASPRARSTRAPILAPILVIGALSLVGRPGAPLLADDRPVTTFPLPAPIPDPWPLAGSTPTHDEPAARASIDAVFARRQSLAMGRVAAALDGAIPVPADPPPTGGAGHVVLSPALAARGLRTAADRGKDAASRTVPEMASVLAAAAFDGAPVDPSRPVLPGFNGVVDRVFQGRFVPQSIDDRPYVLRPNRALSDLKVLPPPPPPRPASAPPSPVSELVVRGVRIDVDEALLRRALAAPNAASEADTLGAIEATLAAAGDGDAAVAALAAFATERKRESLEARGGVEGLRRVSLAKLLAAPAPSGSGASATIGRLTRIFGVACDESAADVTLVGVEEPGVEPIPLEALALAMRCVWREGRVPGCSLDPDPQNPAGPQHVRVFGVPGDSAFAKVMLEADYVMKKVVGRAPGAPETVDGLVDLPAAMMHVGSAGLSTSRFWLTPVPPGPGDVLAAPGRAAALFEARVRVRSEEMRSAGLGGEAGTGSATAAASECAASLSEHYEALVGKAVEFRRLRALFDTVTCARILRILAPRHPLLERLADRPYEKVEVPATYPGITVTHQLGGAVIVLQGGCDLDTRLSGRAFVDAADPVFAALARGGSDGAIEGRVPLSSRGADDGVDAQLLLASAELAAGRAVEAEDRLSDLLDRVPDDPDVLSLRGVARAKAGRVDAGVLDAMEAAALDPSSVTLAATVRHVRHEAGDAQAFAGIGAAEAEVLEASYLTIAAREGVAGRLREAVASAASAMAVRPDSTTAKLLHATLLMLSGDVVIASREAAEVAAADGASVDARVLGALLELRRGDARSARSALDGAIAVKPAADALAYRAIASFLAGELPAAAADTAAAIALDATEPAVQLALETWRGAGCFGRERAAELVKAQLSLPPAIQLAIYSAQSATARGSDAEAATELERALRLLDDPSVPAMAVEAGFVRESVEMMLAKALRGPAMADLGPRIRMEALVADVERRHPRWASPDWIRGSFAQARGDTEDALEAYARAREKDPTGDVLLAQMMPPDAASLRRMVATVEVGLLLTTKDGPGDPRMGPTFDRLEAALAGTPTVGVVAAMKRVFALDRDKRAVTQATVDEVFGAGAKALEGAAPGSYGPPEALDRAMFFGMQANAQAMVDASGLAGPLLALRSLAPRADVFESVWAAIATMRTEAVMGAFGRLVATIDADPRAREADELAVTDADAARRRLDEVARPVREAAAKLGDPIVTFLVDRLLSGGIDTTVAKGIAERIGRIDRVLEVAVDAKKVAVLTTTKASLVAKLKALDTDAAAKAKAARAGVIAALRTPTDLRTFTIVTGRIAARDKGAGLGEAGPEETRRSMELSLAAYLRAIGVAVPESIK